jgi:hypothetical protein
VDNNHVFVKSIVEQTKTVVKMSDQVCPIFFIGVEEDGKINLNIMQADWGGPQEEVNQKKDITANAVQMVAAEMNADFILFVSESWVVEDTANCGLSSEEMRKKYPGSLENHPERKEIVTFMLETRGKQYAGMAPILPERNLGEIEWKEFDRMEGRFTGLLPRRASTLH